MAASGLAVYTFSGYTERNHTRRCYHGVWPVLQIVNYPHPALRYASRSITEIDDDLHTTIRAMFELMYAAKGIGLAANQVGLPFRFFVLNLTADPEKKDQELVFINPEIVKRHSSVEDEEGCLSLPGVYAKVRRARKIRVRAYDLAGKLVEHDADELFSRAVQHESDHLDGKLFIDYLDAAVLHTVADKIKAFEIEYHSAQNRGAVPSDAEVIQQLHSMPRPMVNNSGAFPANGPEHASPVSPESS
jgi:peptide deformylase